jgi:hypothetical protein
MVNVEIGFNRPDMVHGPVDGGARDGSIIRIKALEPRERWQLHRRRNIGRVRMPEKPHEAMTLFYGIRRRREARRDLCISTLRWNMTTRAALIETKTVPGAFELTVAHMTLRACRTPVWATVIHHYDGSATVAPCYEILSHAAQSQRAPTDFPSKTNWVPLVGNHRGLPDMYGFKD